MAICRQADFVAVAEGDDRRGCNWDWEFCNTVFDLGGDYMGIHFIMIKVKDTGSINKCVFATCKFHETKDLTKVFLPFST